MSVSHNDTEIMSLLNQASDEIHGLQDAFSCVLGNKPSTRLAELVRLARERNSLLRSRTNAQRGK